ncbi:MAG: DUF6261 family protein [Paludibacter sp.]|nr:DUF6261 family protein [Paludibacter sp.]
MRKVLVICSLSRVRKSEFPEIMNAILTIIEKYDPVALKIVGMYNLLLELKPLLNLLAVEYDGYPISKDFVAQRMQRNNLLRSILSQLSSIENAAIASTAQQADLAVPYLRSYLNGITKQSFSVKTGRVNQLLTDLEGNEPMTAALNVLGLTVYIDELKTFQQSMNLVENQRRETLSVSLKNNNVNAKEAITNAISNLLDSIELARVEHTELDYMPLINELNVLLTSKQSMIKSRITRRKNSEANKTTTAASSTTTTATAI